MSKSNEVVGMAFDEFLDGMSDAVKATGTKATAARPWTDEDDRFLIFYGRCVGHEFVGKHDLDRVPGEATERFAWLVKNKPDLVRELEADADRDPEI